jgi:hypothetical protein
LGCWLILTGSGLFEFEFMFESIWKSRVCIIKILK